MKLMLLTTLEVVLICVIATIILLLLGFFLVGRILFQLMLKRNNIVGRGIARKLRKMARRFKINYAWWDKFPKEFVSVTSYDELNLYARFIKSKKESNKVAIVIHGFMANHRDTQTYCKYFYERNFNIIAVDNRAHGMSEGEVIGMGWEDRLDVLKWIEFAVKKFGNDCQIVLFGISMGATTVCMSCGENLPNNVKCAISDSAYDCVYNIFYHVMQTNLKVPVQPLAESFDAYNKLFLGSSTKQQSCVEQVKKSKTPILLIHGTGDNFVPFQMMDRIYNSINASLRDKFVVKFAWHGEAQAKNVKKYNSKLDEWIAKFVK